MVQILKYTTKKSLKYYNSDIARLSYIFELRIKVFSEHAYIEFDISC